VCLDARDPHGLADFYSYIVGWPVTRVEPDGAAIAVPGTTAFISFQRNASFRPPTWPTSTGDQQIMLHLDVAVDELDEAVRDAVAHGATVSDFQPQATVRVLLDPEGHPFCLYADRDP